MGNACIGDRNTYMNSLSVSDQYIYDADYTHRKQQAFTIWIKNKLTHSDARFLINNCTNYCSSEDIYITDMYGYTIAESITRHHLIKLLDLFKPINTLVYTITYDSTHDMICVIDNDSN